MRQLITIFFTLLALSAWSQTIQGGGGVCHVSGDPNSVVALEVQDVRAECFAVVDTTSGQLYVYDPTGTIGSRWVQFVSSSGNGIITALPLNTVSIAASANDLQIDDMRMLQLQSRSMIVGAMGASQYDTATTFGRIYEPGFNTPTTAFFDGMKAGRLHSGIDPWSFEYKVGTWGGFNAGDYAYSGFRWDIDTSVYRIRIYAEGNSPDAFPGLEYDADFSADFVARSLVDKAYVDNAIDGNGIYSGSGQLPGNVSVDKNGNSLILTDKGVASDAPFLILNDSSALKFSAPKAIEFRSDGNLFGTIRFVPASDQFEFISKDLRFGQSGVNGGSFGMLNAAAAQYEVLKTDSSLTLRSSTNRLYARGSDDEAVAYPTNRPAAASMWQYNSNGTGEMIDAATLVNEDPPITIDDETLHTTTQTALAGEVVLIDCSSGAVTVNPPASPVKNMKFYVSDAVKSAGTNTITIDFTTASQPLCGGVENYLIENDGGFAGFVYVNGTTGWIPLNR